MNLEKEMNEFAKANHVPVMMDEGVELLIAKVKEYNCKSFLELGTAIARTAIRVASLDPEMRVVTIERNPEMIEQAKINIKQSGYQNQITLIEGDALEVELPDQKFDFIFIDAAKAQYTRFFKKYSPLSSSVAFCKFLLIFDDNFVNSFKFVSEIILFPDDFIVDLFNPFNIVIISSKAPFEPIPVDKTVSLISDKCLSISSCSNLG